MNRNVFTWLNISENVTSFKLALNKINQIISFAFEISTSPKLKLTWSFSFDFLTFCCKSFLWRWHFGRGLSDFGVVARPSAASVSSSNSYLYVDATSKAYFRVDAKCVNAVSSIQIVFVPLMRLHAVSDSCGIKNKGS